MTLLIRAKYYSFCDFSHNSEFHVVLFTIHNPNPQLDITSDDIKQQYTSGQTYSYSIITDLIVTKFLTSSIKNLLEVE